MFFWIVILLFLLFGVGQILTTSTGVQASGLIINEILATNGTGLTDEDGDYSDWIEIYNRGSQAINLSGWSLTDDPGQPEKWTFPDATLGGHEYLVVFASGKDRKDAGRDVPLHTNFNLNKKAEFLGLYNVFQGKFMDTDSPQFPEQFRDMSYGRHGDKLAYGYLGTPTPGGPNDETLVWEAVVSPVGFNVERGFYDTPFVLGLSTTTAGAAVRYTTDGSEPTETHGTIYAGPIAVDTTTVVRAVAFRPDSLSSYVNTHTYIFPDSVLGQPTDPPGFPSTWGTHKNGDPVIADYEMDPEVVSSSRDRDMIRSALKSIPTLSLATDARNLDIYANTEGRGEAWERPASVELIYPNGDRPGFQINSGLRIHGGVGRSTVIPKHSFRLLFKGEYGATKLEYPLFPDSPVERFDTITLRAGMNRSYAGKTREPRVDLRLTTYTRDEWLRSSQIAMSGVGSHGIFVHLYLNGLYWGLYNIVERPDASFTSSYLGGRKEDWYAVKHDGPVSGSGERFEALHSLASAGGLEDPEKYAAIKQYIDTAHFIDYIIVNFHSGNEDWALTNWYAGVRNPEGKVKYFAWDGELTWIDGAWLYSSPAGEPLIKSEVLFKALLQNPDFRMEFADRIYRHLFNDGALTDANSRARWIEINAPINLAIVGEAARWGDVRYEPPIDRDNWLKAYDNVLAQMDGNVAKWIALTREAGYYPDIDPPAFNQHSDLVTTGFTLTMTAPGGVVYYTTDGSDPRAEGTGLVAPDAIEYRSPLMLTTTTRVRARVLAEDTWSALHETTFEVVERKSDLSITEIMYNPSDGSDYEFIELKNIGNGDLNLANMYFDEGITFSFPPVTAPLSPGELVVLVGNATAFAERYPGIPVGGTYRGSLSNTGEKITLKGAEGHVVVSVGYDDENGWPISPDGRGDSLVLKALDGNPDNPRNWLASALLNGSPGADEPTAGGTYRED